jgi:type IV pilus assembly protein PilA
MPHIIRRFFCALTVILIASGAGAQTTPPATSQPTSAFAEELKKYPGLGPALQQLGEQLQNLQYPPPRTHSDILSLLPGTTNVYAALPNYGDTAHQALQLFETQLQQNSALRDWWTRSAASKSAPKIQAALEKYSELSQYLGDEIVIAASVEDKNPRLLVIAQVQKPGLKQELQQFIDNLQVSVDSHQPIRILDPQQLATVQLPAKNQPLLVLVRPDFVVASSDIATLRNFNSQLDHGKATFASTIFGQRIVQSYQGGAVTVVAADLHDILRQLVPPTQPAQTMLKNSGFSDAQYLVWKHSRNETQSLSESEITFSGPRRGIASWLGAPAQLGSLDFVSPNALMSFSVNLKSPALIFDDIQQFAAAANPNAANPLAQPQQMLGVDIKSDLLRQLSGELTVEFDSLQDPGKPAFKLILRTIDSQRLQQTLARMLATINTKPQQYTDGGVTYYVVETPSAKGTNQFAYAFVSGYLIFGSSRDAVAEAVHAHQTGDSLARSSKLQASLSSDHPAFSALMYQDPVAMTKLQLQQVPPEIAQWLSSFNSQATPTVVAAYAAPDSIRTVSTSAAADTSTVLIAAAIIMPNLLRSKMAANEATAVGNIRKVNSAQHTYETNYTDHGFAPDLASLGPGAVTPAIASADHANLLEAELGAPTCSGASWCEVSGYRFAVKAACGLGRCNNYVIAATPANGSTGTRSFCSASDGVVHYTMGAPLKTPPTLRDCHLWPVLK